MDCFPQELSLLARFIIFPNILIHERQMYNLSGFCESDSQAKLAKIQAQSMIYPDFDDNFISYKILNGH